MNDSLLSMLVGRAREQRLRLGWTQADVAARVGISRRTYMRFERSGAVTVPQLARVLQAVGLTLTVTLDASETAPTVDPRAARVRQRGLRRARPVPPPRSGPPKQEAAPASSAPAGVPTTAAPQTAVRQEKPTAPADPAIIARIAKDHSNALLMLVRAIVANGLTHYTAQQVVRNVMTTERGLTEADRPAFLAALEQQLKSLTSENIAAFGLSTAELDHWSPTWKSGLSLIDLLGAN